MLPAMSDPDKTPKTYEGSCHCGAVRYEVDLEPAPDRAYACNCSICGRAGWLLAFLPAARFRLLAGQDALTDYQFGKKSIHHLFCSTCGVRSFARGNLNGKELAAVNVRCLEGVDLKTLKTREFDGNSL